MKQFNDKPAGNSDVAGLTEAIRIARSSGTPTKIVFEEGIYNFFSTDQSSTGNPRYFFTLIRQDNIEIDGQGATFVVENYNRGLFRILDSTNVSFGKLEMSRRSLIL